MRWPEPLGGAPVLRDETVTIVHTRQALDRGAACIAGSPTRVRGSGRRDSRPFPQGPREVSKGYPARHALMSNS